MPLFLCLLTVFLIGTVQTVSAKKVGDWEYETYKEKNATFADLVWYYGTASSITVPSSIDGYKVGRLTNTFSGNTILTTVTIPSGITRLENTFYGCTHIKKINLPSSVTVYLRAFEECGIEEITLPKGSYELSSAFINCPFLKKVVIPGSPTNLEFAFSGCPNLTSVSIANASKDPVTDYLFSECKKLETVTIPEGITDLSTAFYNCPNLKTVHLPKSLLYMPGFVGCNKLKDIYFARSKCEWTGMLAGYYEEEGDKLKQASVHYAAADKHDFTDWEVITEADCTESGKAERTCVRCNAVEKKVLPKLSHKYSDWTLSHEAGAKAGTIIRTCSLCGKNEKKVTTATGIIKDNSRWIYLKNGKFSAVTGLARRIDGRAGWYYVEKGIYRKDKSGLARRVDGRRGWFYVENGAFRARTGLARRIDGRPGWYYVEKGSLTAKTGITKRIDGRAGWFYVEKGLFRKDRIGLTRRTDGKGGWYYVEGGLFRKNKTGLTRRADGRRGWFYMKNGVFDGTKTGVAPRADGRPGLYYVKNGSFQAFTGKVRDSDDGKVYNVVRGTVK